MSLHDAQARLAVSTVIFAISPEADGDGGLRPSLRTPLVRRLREPGLGRWALPGGWLPVDESLAGAAARTLAETTGLSPRYLEQLYTFGEPERSPGERVVSVVYWALVHSDEVERAVSDENVRWFDEDDLPDLAFDHAAIIEYALTRLRTKLEYSRIAHALLPERFTMAELRGVHEAVLRRRLDPANFRRTMEATGTLVDTGERLSGTRHRPPALYRFDPAHSPAAPPSPAPAAPRHAASASASAVPPRPGTDSKDTPE
ncbi:NUDIX domain-containing protein [Agromyces aurantiacus]|uniref:NUDIX domain-containing protein n=1 Tax=Agromyces aurantiacus TaxID=165814 RepID=A0ABV9RB59_9MICO|nr:NUDIX domain-containing protein [Agromyces aurantiacus]MBM7505338.1 ADP-ribose pyrophosphatase YjhB (NUDIX family) [Agromyces aurantiacus]